MISANPTSTNLLLLLLKITQELLRHLKINQDRLRHQQLLQLMIVLFHQPTMGFGKGNFLKFKILFF
jgi:hypothetical protein